MEIEVTYVPYNKKLYEIIEEFGIENNSKKCFLISKRFVNFLKQTSKRYKYDDKINHLYLEFEDCTAILRFYSSMNSGRGLWYRIVLVKNLDFYYEVNEQTDPKEIFFISMKV